MDKIIKFLKNVNFFKFIFQKLKCCLWCSASGLCKWKAIINFILSVKLQKIDFLQDLQKAYIFYANHFLYFWQKKSRSKLCLELHDTYVLFRTFYSQVNNKPFFFIQAPLRGSAHLKKKSFNIYMREKHSKQNVCIMWF